MAYRLFSGTFSSTTDGADLVTAANRDSIVFSRTAQYASMGHLAHVLAIGRGITAIINGELYSGDGPTVYGRFPTSTNNDFTIGATGVVSSLGAAAFSIAGSAMTLKNGGEISGTVGVLSTANSNAISNYGDITGAIGISLNGASAIVTNVGHIVGSQYGVSITGSGGGQQITNSGLIDGENGTAINVRTDGSVMIVNDGIITAATAINLDIDTADDQGDRTIVNTGTITGLSNAVFGSAGGDTLRNDGHISGRIDLFSGNDLFDGHNGTNTGLVGGGSGDDTIIGSLTGRNLLGGGSGNDELTGGNANDVLIGGSGADILSGGDGFDTVSYVDATLGVHASLSGSTNDDGDTYSSIEALRGSEYNDVLTAGDTGQRLSGGGGDDILFGYLQTTLVGGAGNDSYSVSGSDRVIEAVGEGIDTINSYGGYKLPDNVENLNVYGGDPSQFYASTGNSLANVMIGDTGRDVLDGGEGQDTLTGNSGADSFTFSKALTAANVDTITDFNPAEDFIRLFRPALGLPSSGSTSGLSDAAFYVGASAHDGDDRVIYNSATGNLFFDIDGTGSAPQLQIAHLNNNPALTAADFFIFG